MVELNRVVRRALLEQVRFKYLKEGKKLAKQVTGIKLSSQRTAKALPGVF